MTNCQKSEIVGTGCCQECGKPLKLIGTARKNGKTSHGDWATREYHKKCFKEKQKYSQTINMLNFRENVLDKILNKNVII